jgi:DegV family protein with EDD domain
MDQKMIIASDSTCDLGSELMNAYGIKILPLTINLGGQLYADGTEIDPDTIYAHYEKTGEIPKTSAINIADFEEFFGEQTKNGAEVVFFTISSTMSATYHNACLAAEDFPGVHIVDTQNLSTGGGLLVLAAAEMAQDGKLNAAEIADACRKMAPCVDASFVIDNLEFLHKGGRCSAVAAFGANLLQLKPCIGVSEGKMGVGKKYRGKFAMVLQKYIEDRVGDGTGICKKRIFVTHAGCDAEIVQQCVDQVKALQMFDEVLVTRAGCTVSSHCGRNTLGVLFVKE